MNTSIGAPVKFNASVTRRRTYREERLARETSRLKQVVGELTVELKKAIGKRSPDEITND